jgi:hypothetical protein
MKVMKKLCAVIILCTACVTWADLPALTGGWEVEYNSSSGVLPNTDSGWSQISYNDNSVNGPGTAVIQDGVLVMNNQNNGTEVLDSFSYAGPPGTNGLITMEVTFRLTDDTQTADHRQFQLQVRRQNDAGVHLWVASFAKDRVVYTGGNSSVWRNAMYAFGTTWHTVRWVIDVKNEWSWMQVDGSVTPLYTAVEALDTTGDNRTFFGDSTSDADGIVELSHIAWTNTEIPPVPTQDIWQFQYDASSGVLPSGGQWAVTNYPTGYLSVADGAVTFINTDTGTCTIGNTTGYPGGATHNRTAMEFDFRLTDAAQADSKEQFCVQVRRQNDAGYQTWAVKFAKDRVTYTNGDNTGAPGSNSKYVLYPVGTSWHTVRWCIDAKTRVGMLYIDGSDEPLFLSFNTLNAVASADNRIYMGDGSSAVAGGAQMHYVRWTNTSLFGVPSDYTLVAHNGSNDPSTGGTEGWSTEYNTTGDWNWDMGPGGEGENAYWYIDDYGDVAGRFSYISPAIPANVMNASGWTATARVQVVNTSAFPSCKGGVTLSVHNGGLNRFDLNLVDDANPAVRGVYYANYANELLLVHNLDVTQIHTYQIIYDPMTDSAGVYIDGHLFKTLNTADVYYAGTSTARVRWGSISTLAIARSNWYHVSIATGQNPVDDTYAFSIDDVSEYAIGDFDKNAKVDGADLLKLVNQWLNTAPAPLTATASLSTVDVAISDAFLVRENAQEHLNFSRVFKVGDDVIWHFHSRGEHTVSEVQERWWSLDNGKTWVPTNINFQGFNLAIRPDGKIMGIKSWNTTAATSQPIQRMVFNDPVNGSAEILNTTVALPYSSTLCAHESLVMLPNGDWIQTAYGKKSGDEKLRTIFLKSTDQGQTWSYLSDISSPVGGEGICEATMQSLNNGNLLCIMRSGGSTGDPLYQAVSTDSGVTWSTPTSLAGTAGGVSPCLRKLQHGGLVCSFGKRPASPASQVDAKVILLVDLTGTGNNWESLDIYQGLGSVNTSVVEVEPDVLAVYYDASGFGEENLPTGTPNRLVYKTVSLLFGPPATCGARGTRYLAEDISGPDGTQDCRVNLFDFAFFAEQWLDCAIPGNNCE